MSRLKAPIISVLIFLTFTPSIVLAGEVKALVPEKPWQATINLNEFEPWDLLQPKTILGGSTKDGVRITIITEKTKPGTKPSEIRKLYVQRSLTGFGQVKTAERFDINDIAVLLFKWAKPNISKLSEEDAKWAKQAVKNTWSYHGYVVKDNVAFDIHLSADMSEHTKNQMLDIIKSFQIKPSMELEECKKLYESLGENIDSKEKEKLLRNFIEKYPNNSEAYCFLAEHYLSLGQFKQIKNAYLKALQNHKIQPLINLMSLWKCYDGLGRYFRLSGEHDLSKQYIQSGYELAKKAKMPVPIIASSAYNLACLYAEINDINNSIKRLRESIRLNPRYKEKAKIDRSFANIKENPRFKNLIRK